MNRTELVAAVAADTGLGTDVTEATVKAVLEAVARTVATGEDVVLAGFGTFERRHRPARTGRNPRTGEPLLIAESRLPAFKPATAFKRRLAGS